MLKNFAIILAFLILDAHAFAAAQSAGSGGTVEVVVSDPSGAAVSGATTTHTASTMKQRGSTGRPSRGMLTFTASSAC